MHAWLVGVDLADTGFGRREGRVLFWPIGVPEVRCLWFIYVLYKQRWDAAQSPPPALAPSAAVLRSATARALADGVYPRLSLKTSPI